MRAVQCSTGYGQGFATWRRQQPVAESIWACTNLRLEDDAFIDGHHKGSVLPVDDPLQQLRHRAILFRNTIPLAIAYVVDHPEEQWKISFRPEAVKLPAHSIHVQPKVIDGEIANRQTAFIGDRARYRHESGRLAKHGRILRQHCRCHQKGKYGNSEMTPHERNYCWSAGFSPGR